MASPTEVTTRGSAVFFVMAWFGVLAGFTMPVFQKFSVAGNAGYACLTHLPQDFLASSTSTVDGARLLAAHETALPAGRYCEWATATGEVVSYQTGWATTAIAGVATAGVVVMTIMALRNDRPSSTPLTLTPVVLTALCWVCVCL